MNHSNLYKCFTAGGRPLIILGQPTRAVEPAERPLHDPTLGLHHEADLTHQLFDHYPQPTPSTPSVTQRRVKVAVAPQDLDPLDRLAQLLDQGYATDAILNTSRHHQQRPHQPQRVNRHKPLATVDFFSPHRGRVGHPVRWSSPTGCRG